MSLGKVIVFGPTGNVGSITARTAQEHGAKVYLAMRDPQKAIPGLSAEQEKKDGFERVQADLTDPSSVAAAVSKSGAKRAFIYLAFGASDHMKSTLEALKSAGIEFLVFLSSYSISGAPSEAQPSDIITFAHAQVEINIEKIFSSGSYVAVRSGHFATNALRSLPGIHAGDVKLFCPDAGFDHITPTDMGRVSGTILAKGPQDGQKIVYLYGPEMLSAKDAVKIIAKALDKDIKITPVFDVEGGVELNKAAGIPEHMARYLGEKLGEIKTGKDAAMDLPCYEEGVKNVEKYSGRPPTTFQQWFESNKEFYSK